MGHPNAAGYDMLAKVFFNVIQGIDTVSPVPGIIMPVNGAANVKPDTPIQVDVWDFGTGIDLANTFLLVDGQAVAATPQGTALHARSPTSRRPVQRHGDRRPALAATSRRPPTRSTA